MREEKRGAFKLRRGVKKTQAAPKRSGERIDRKNTENSIFGIPAGDKAGQKKNRDG